MSRRPQQAVHVTNERLKSGSRLSAVLATGANHRNAIITSKQLDCDMNSLALVYPTGGYENDLYREAFYVWHYALEESLRIGNEQIKRDDEKYYEPGNVKARRAEELRASAQLAEARRAAARENAAKQAATNKEEIDKMIELAKRIEEEDPDEWQLKWNSFMAAD